MTGRTRSLWADRSGASAVEAAFAVPVIVALVMGILQIGMFFLANAGLRQGVESGARFASIYPTPDDTAIVARARANAYGMDTTRMAITTPVRGTDATNGQRFIEISGSYPYTFNFIFFNSSAITLRYSRRVYLMPS